MASSVFAASSRSAIPIFVVTAQTWVHQRAQLSPAAQHWCAAQGFEAQAGRHILIPSAQGQLQSVLYAIAQEGMRINAFAFGALVQHLPAGVYALVPSDIFSADDDYFAALSWALSSYHYTKYKNATCAMPRLCLPKGCDGAQIAACVEAMNNARDLINTPAQDMGPAALERAARRLAQNYKARLRITKGEALLKANLPLIHAVGRAAHQAPRLVDISWGSANAPKVTLVGKGVCFDTGGLDIKPGSAMLLMKKDMAGAATAIALAQMIMAARLPVRLRVLLPIVENAISASAFRPGDVYPSRKGLNVEIGNTDAEGRLILADALTLADEEKPDLICDFATLTGAARVALGPDLPPFYTHDDELAQAIATHGTRQHDPVWRLPLWQPYMSMLDSKIAHTNNVSQGPFAGSITAALFLSCFVTQAKSWVHFDIYGWSPQARAGRPEGGDPQTARLMFDLIRARYQKPSPAARTKSKPRARR